MNKLDTSLITLIANKINEFRVNGEAGEICLIVSNDVIDKLVDLLGPLIFQDSHTIIPKGFDGLLMNYPFKIISHPNINDIITVTTYKPK